jgi:hypothetical protein
MVDGVARERDSVEVRGGGAAPLCSRTAHTQKVFWDGGLARLPFVLAHRALQKVLAGRAQ